MDINEKVAILAGTVEMLLEGITIAANAIKELDDEVDELKKRIMNLEMKLEQTNGNATVETTH